MKAKALLKSLCALESKAAKLYDAIGLLKAKAERTFVVETPKVKKKVKRKKKAA